MLVLFRHIDESELTSRERELVKLTKDELSDIAAPMATVAAKNKYARKHGRTVIAMADSYESVIDLLIWMRRVNRIAKKYKPAKTQQQAEEYIEGTVYDGQVPQPDHQQPNIYNRGTG